MPSELPREVLYVHKLHYLAFLWSVTLLAGTSAGLIFNRRTGLAVGLIGAFLSYLLTLSKKKFITPSKLAIARRLAEQFRTPDLPPHPAAVAATQMYYLLGDAQRAVKLLKSYLPSREPFVYITLADIYLDQGKTREALASLQPVLKEENPLIQWTLGRIYLQRQDYPTALKHLKKAQKISQTKGFPPAQTGLLNNLFMQWSIKSSLCHAIAECYHKLGESRLAQKFLKLGNLYLLDITLWCRQFPIFNSEN